MLFATARPCRPRTLPRRVYCLASPHLPESLSGRPALPAAHPQPQRRTHDYGLPQVFRISPLRLPLSLLSPGVASGTPTRQLFVSIEQPSWHGSNMFSSFNYSRRGPPACRLRSSSTLCSVFVRPLADVCRRRTTFDAVAYREPPSPPAPHHTGRVSGPVIEILPKCCLREVTHACAGIRHNFVPGYGSVIAPVCTHCAYALV